MSDRKLRVGIISNPPVIKTGLARNIGSYLPILYKSNKYEIFMLCQGMQDGDPNFQRLPWTCNGVFKNFDQNRFNQDESYRRFVSYGNAVIEDFVIKNKLDVVIHSDDIWSSNIDAYIKQGWYQYMKHNFVQHTTADSLPILPDFKEWAKNCPNMWFWTSFAEKALKEENLDLYKHCKTVHGSIKGDDFSPLPKYERLKLRNKFGISDDEKIFIYLGRNQIRKVGFWSNIEALAEFKKKYPDRKIRLLYHCSWSEPGGWPIDRIREENKIKREDILTTYYCRNCNDWNIRPYEGEDLACSCCKSEKGRITAGIGSTIDEKELNKIYNIADASVSYPNSGGLEYTNVESLLAGLPLSTVPYAGTSEFTSNDFVHKIKGTFCREIGTAFKKFIPDIQSIIEFYEQIFDMPIDTRTNIIKRGREWAMQEFDAKNIAKIYESFLDNCKPIDWDDFLNKKNERKDPDAQIYQSDNQIAWLKSLYKNILKMNVKDDDSGLLFWDGELNTKKRTPQDVENYFRGVAQQENIKNSTVSFESLLENNGKKRLLLSLKESIGDHFILTSLLPEIANKYENTDIYIACDEKFFEVYENNPYVKKCIKWFPECDNELWATGQSSHKGYFDFFNLVGIATQHRLNYLSSKYN